MMNKQKQTMQKIKRSHGVTLVELMIALVISTIVLLGVATVYSSTKRSYKVQEEMGRLQENARYAFNIMARDIRGAGYVGCNPILNNLLDESHGDYNDHLGDFQSGVDGWEYTAGTTAPGEDYTITSVTATGGVGDWTGYNWPNSGTGLASVLANNVIQGTDVLVTKSVQPVTSGGAYLTQQGTNPPNSASVTFTTATGIEQGQILIFGNCQRGDVFQNGSTANSNNVNRNPGTAGLSPGNKGPTSSVMWSQNCTACQISEAKGIVYFIGRGASDEPALFRYDFSLGASGAVFEELVEGIESMQLLYGEDLDTTDQDIQPSQYVTADNISDPDNVVSVRISLLVRTPEELNRPQTASTHRLLGVDNNTGVDITTQNDRRVRKVFTTTVFMRNKGVARTRNN